MKVLLMVTVIRTKIARMVAAMVCVLVLVGTGTVARGAEAIKGEILSVGLGGVRGKDSVFRTGSWVPVRVNLENHTGKEFEGYLAVQQHDLDGDKVVSRKHISLAATVATREEWVYYWPSPDMEGRLGTQSVIVMDMDNNIVNGIGMAGVPAGKAGAAQTGHLPFRSISPKDDRAERSCRWVVGLGPAQVGISSYADGHGGTEGLLFSRLSTAGDLPTEAMGLDGVDVIIWEADRLRVNELAPEFQLKAIQDWTRAGGHLIISVSAQWQDFQDATTKLGGMLPIKATGTGVLSAGDLARVPGFSRLKGTPEMKGVTQLQGVLAAGARRLGPIDAPFDVHPFAATIPYGRGVVTLVTIDLTNPEYERQLGESDWPLMWEMVAGWQGEVLTSSQFKQLEEEAQKAINGDKKILNAAFSELHLGDYISAAVDVSDVTQVRVVIAVLFLAVYWLAAGPLGYLALRFYNRTHWSWWIFGGTVVVAAGVAGAAVLVLQLTSYDVRHKTIVMGTVGSDEVSVVGFYGVFVPKSGIVQVELPKDEAGLQGGGISYVVPLTPSMENKVLGFPDPQSYFLDADRSSVKTGMVFRRTLKKVQARWEGQAPGLSTEIPVAVESVAGVHSFTGSLRNVSGYDLDRVELVYLPERAKPWSGVVYTLGDPTKPWVNGTRMDLHVELKRQTKGGKVDTNLQEIVRALAQERAKSLMTVPTGFPKATVEEELTNGRTEDFLWAFWDSHIPPALRGDAGQRVEVVRSWARLFDRSESLRASGAVIVARAGDVSRKNYVASPVPVTVDMNKIETRGEITFLWSMPLVSKSSGMGAPRLKDGPERAKQPIKEEIDKEEPP